MAIANGVRQHIFFVDDETSMLEIAHKSLEHLDVQVSCFSCANECLEQLRSQRCDLLITDVEMPGMDGLALTEEAKRIAPWIKVLVVSGYGDIPMAVRALRAGALNFIEKPLSRENLISAVESALEQGPPADSLTGKELTKTERKVLHYILSGNSNKQTATILHRSEKTIEVHRNRIMRKLGADNVVDLLKRAAAMGLVDLSPK